MTQIESFHIQKPPLDALIALLSLCGEVVSVFLKAKPPLRHRPGAERDQTLRLLFECEGFHEACSDLGTIGGSVRIGATLNRLEFEGSLLSVALQGGCHRSTSHVSMEQARAIVQLGLSAAFPEPFSELLAFRIDNDDWCQFAEEATVFASYVVNQPARGLWWVLCVADQD